MREVLFVLTGCRHEMQKPWSRGGMGLAAPEVACGVKGRASLGDWHPANSDGQDSGDAKERYHWSQLLQGGGLTRAPGKAENRRFQMDPTQLGELLRRHKAISECQRLLVERLGQTGRDLEILGKALREVPSEVKLPDSSFLASASGAEHRVPHSALDVDILVKRLSDLEDNATALREIEAKLIEEGFGGYVPGAGGNSAQAATGG